MPIIYFNIAFASYFLAVIFYALGIFFRNRPLPILGRLAVFCAIAALILYIAGRWQAAGRPPLSNMFESLIVFACAIAVFILYTDVRYKINGLCATGALLGLLVLGGASLQDKEITPLLPALKSNWLTIHVLTCFIGYAALTIGFISSIVMLCKRKEEARLDAISQKMIAFGFFFLTLGIITGAVWANSAWGTYWSWDPKETWSLITWLIYAIYLHLRFTRGWKAKKAAWVSVIGFLAMLFTYFGVNYLLSGLHSYV